MMDTFRAQASARLAAFERLAIEEAARRAAVAILVAPHEGELCYALTKRSYKLRHNAGNYALPGGGIDPGETAFGAALRETHEELGVALPADAALGALDDFATLGGHVVTPVVLWSRSEIALKPNPDEVHAAWLLPLSQLEADGAPRFRNNPSGPPILQMPARDGWINAPTAAWLYQFREVVLRGNPVRLDNVGQPGWTAH